MTDKHSLLIVEDDYKIIKELSNLLHCCYRISVSETGIGALRLLEEKHYDLILLDIDLPDINRFDVLRSLRNQRISSKVFILSNRAASQDKIRCLDMGANDYITKPFDSGELLSRIKVHLRTSDLPIICFGNTTLVPESRSVRTEDEILRLTPCEYLILNAMINSSDYTIRRDIIIHLIDIHGIGITNRTVDVHISRIRKKLQSIHSNLEIRSIRGHGYILEVSSY